MKSQETEYYTIEDFTSVDKYDAHVHVNTRHPAFIKQSAEDHFRLLTINVDVPTYLPIAEQQKLALAQMEAFPGQVMYATSFTVHHFNRPGWQQETLAYLQDSFSKGAATVKVWKNIGMELKDEAGHFVMIDHPRFDPILEYLAEHHIPLIGHLGEPRNCWLPVEEMTVQGDKNYFSAHPEYHMYLHPEYPSYEAQIQARDHMLEKHPDLQFIGAHLASLEWSVDELSRRLDQFPNMAVDLAERISHLQYQAVTDWQKVRDFFIRYQDRILYGTDLEADETTDPSALKQHAHEVRLRHWQFFTTDAVMKVPKVAHAFKGVKLPKAVVDKIYCKNAKRWLVAVKP